MTTDPFSPDDPTYHPDEFYVASTDGRGHTTKMRVNLPPMIAAQLGQLVASRSITAYRTVQDIIRDALIHRLHHLQNEIKIDDLGQALDLQIMRSRLDTQRQKIEELTALLDDTKEILATVDTANDDHALAIAIDQAKTQASILQEPWATRMWQIIERHDR